MLSIYRHFTNFNETIYIVRKVTQKRQTIVPKTVTLICLVLYYRLEIACLRNYINTIKTMTFHHDCIYGHFIKHSSVTLSAEKQIMVSVLIERPWPIKSKRIFI